MRWRLQHSLTGLQNAFSRRALCHCRYLIAAYVHLLKIKINFLLKIIVRVSKYRTAKRRELFFFYVTRYPSADSYKRNLYFVLCVVFTFMGWGAKESTWYCGHCLVFYEYTSPRWEMVIVKQSVEWELAGETEIFGEKLPQCHFVHHKSHMTWPRLEFGPPWWEAGD
jgi:hypothetical protein